MLEPEDEGAVIVRKVGNCLPKDTASHPRGLGFTEPCFVIVDFCTDFKVL